MKKQLMKTTTALLVAMIFTLTSTGCGKPKTLNGVKYDTRGVFTEKNPNVEYEVSIGNVVWSVILFETIVFPIYFIGFSLYNPVSLKSDTNHIVGAINK